MQQASKDPSAATLPRDPIIGLDVGSTTVKAVVVEPASGAVLWADYQRHQTRQPEKVLEFLTAIERAFPDVPRSDLRCFITGSGGGPLAEPIGAKFVQEVNAVTLAVETLHPDVGSVVELGGQDAKIIIFKDSERGGRSVFTSMNDKCASGTGATIDKCLIKVGLSQEEVARIPWDETRLHHVAAKCGVFAETDIVNLVKSGVPAPEIICSLADAIVLQNLSVLTRGNTLRAKVLLLGGPNTYLPFLKACWRTRIPATWEERGYDHPRDVSIEELILTPENAQYYAAHGAVLHGRHEPAEVGRYRGTADLEAYITHGRKARLGAAAGPALVRAPEEVEDFAARYAIPPWTPPPIACGAVVEGVIGLDGGSTSSKAVLVDMQGRLLKKEYQLSRGNPIQDSKELLARLKRHVHEDCGAQLVVRGFGATGYAADVLEECLRIDVNVVETVAHMLSAVHFFGDVDVICDIGGQDIKVLLLQNGDIRNFRLSNQCSAGNGMLLQAMADQFGLDVRDYADHAFRAELSPKFSYGCAVFLDSDRVNFQKEGYTKEEMLAGLAQVLPKNIWQYVAQIPRLASLGRRFVLQGGTQYNLAAVKAQVDYIEERVPDAEVYIHPHTGEAGAIGAAMEALRVVERRGQSSFIGLDAAIGLEYQARNDETTRCHFCANECSRTFIDARTPDGHTARYISGFSCEQGTVESKEALKTLTRRRKDLMKQYPNLVDYEAEQIFRHFHDPAPLPADGQPVADIEVKKTWSGKIKRTPVERPFCRSGEAAAQRRARLRIGIPRVLNIWSVAPFLRTYFETLGVARQNVVFSDYTSEQLWQEGGKYGSVDPCYPAKVAQAHVHNLLFHHHSEAKPLDCLFFPCITQLPSPLKHTMAHTACPIVAGTPLVIRSAFTKETDFFAARGIVYLNPALPFTEPALLKQRLFETFGERLGITEDESDFACEQGFEAMRRFDADIEARGRAILEEVEADNRVALLLLGRPYHSDPGLNHGVLEEFQALGYPILSIRSIPKDEAWLARFFEEDLKSGRIESPLDIRDVWPENYSANSALKVWAAKFAARHPNVVVLDLSSFKCGHDAPTYGIVDGIVSSAATPYSALHDIDANKPGGSIKIRVKTYAHALKLHQERLEDAARKKEALAHRIDLKRLELLELKARQLAERQRSDPEFARELAELRGRILRYQPRAPAADGKRRVIPIVAVN
jgi:activator of 2-hydroxyglutaryl-CoA dehydratase/predicted nucleotide-binding protein (sugar kinase/HSP70/actin superfamily)